MSKYNVILLVLFLLLSVSIFAQSNSAVAYMKLGVGARAMAMGGTGTASVDNATGGYWNPAGLVRIKHIEFTSMYTGFMDNAGWDRNFYYASLAMKFKFGIAAFSWINASVPNIAGFDEYGVSTGEFNASDDNLSFSYAFPLKNIKFGFTAKMYISKIDDDRKSGFGSDLGVIWDINRFMSIGTMFRDIYGNYAEDDIPIQYNLGVVLHPLEGLSFSSDFRKNEGENEMTTYFGMEYKTGFGDDEEVNSSLYSLDTCKDSKSGIISNTQGALRAGFSDGSLTAGLGLMYKMVETNYAYVSGKEGLSDTHRISLILHF